MPMNMSPIQRFWGMLSLYRIELRQIYLYAIFNGLVNLSLPIGIQAIVGYIQTGNLTSSWVVLVGLVLVGIAISGQFQVRQLQVVESIQQNIFIRSGVEFAYRIPNINALRLDKTHTPELVNRFLDTLTIQKGLPKILIDFSLASFQIVFGLVLLAIYSPFFIILAFVLIFILWIIFRITGPKGLETSLKESKYKYKLLAWLEDVARVNLSFKVNNQGKLHLSKTDAISSKYVESRDKHFQVLLNQFRMFIGFKVIVAAGLLVLGGFLVFQDRLTIGQFVAAEIIIILIINSVEKIIRTIDVIYDVLTALEKIGSVMDLELDDCGGKTILEAHTPLNIKANHIDFYFPDSPKKIIKNLSFEVPANGRAMITGAPGSGKSTLLRLLAGVYRVDDGEILINKIPSNNYHCDNLRSQIGVVFPSNQIFEGSFRENITLGKSFSDQEIYEATHQAGLDQYLAKLPHGLNSPVDSEGRRLARNIIQKLQIARAIIGQPKLLLLEAPLHFVVDHEKNGIIDFLMDPAKDWTVIVVSDYAYWQEKCSQIIEL